MQWPIGKEDNFEGVIDLITMKAYLLRRHQRREGPRAKPIPAELLDDAKTARQHMLEALSMYSDELMELLLSEEDVPEELIHDVVREAVQGQDLTPVFMGTAYKNKGVQPLLDAIVRYLPSPLDRPIKAKALGQARRKNSRSSPIRTSRSSAWPSRSSKIRSAS